MQEINELKNLVIQSLEGNGVLGQIRAQIRASVFKVPFFLSKWIFIKKISIDHWNARDQR